ncbi:MAG: hypothetical protein QXS02_02240, partial [Candidatus Thermoplasmatota archaeon]
MMLSGRGLSTTRSTTLYFTPYKAFNIDEIDTLENAKLSIERPVNDDYTRWPPDLLVRDKNKMIPSVNSEIWLSWFQMWIFFKFFDKIPDMKEFSETAEFRSLMDMFNPFKVREDYVYTGVEKVEINDKIVFDLYFSSKSNVIHKDTIKVSLSKSMFFFSQELMNTTITITPVLLKGRMKHYQVVLDCTDKHIEVNPGDTLTFGVEIIPSERAISKVMNELSKRGFEEKLLGKAERLSVFLSNRRNQKLKDLGSTLQEFLNMTEEFKKEGVDITLVDIGDLIEGLCSSSFIFASKEYPSSVTLPLAFTPTSETKIITYYLYNVGTEHILEERIPTGEKPVEEKLSESRIIWRSDPLERNKIIKISNVTATLYLDYHSVLNIRKITLAASLYDEDKAITSTSVILERRGLLNCINEKTMAVTLSFNDIDYEIFHGHRLGLSLSLSNNTKLGLRKVLLLTNSTDTPSSLRVHYEETNNIKVKTNQTIIKITPGGKTVYNLNITSKYTDKIKITTTNMKKNGNWTVTVTPKELDITNNSSKIVKVYVNSTDLTKKAYGQEISFNVEVTGKTGKIIIPLSTVISKDAIRYDVDIVNYSKTKEVKKGENTTLTFRIKNNNTGAIDESDNYRVIASSANEWNLQY